jgi:predicted protein tyrosine phosphatase
MKVLTVCQRGNCRSVALAYVLKDVRGQSDILSCGIETTSPQTFDMLGEWAEKIVVCAELEILQRVPTKFSHKTEWANVGPDRWQNASHPELIQLMKQVAVNVLGS